MRLFFVMNASQVEAEDVFSCFTPLSNPPPILPEEARTSSSIYQNRSRSVLTRQHSAASRVDKRSAARLTRPAEAELSLFFDLAALVALLLLTGFILLLAVFV